MNHSFANQTKSWVARVLGGAALPVLFLLLCGTGASAQERAVNGIHPSLTTLATMLNVTAYDHGTWDEATVAPKIQAAMDVLQPKVANGSATNVELLKYVYYSRVYTDITKYDIGVEVSMLTQLTASHTLIKSDVQGPQLAPGGPNQMASIYNGLVSIL